eukprot:7123053-Pyramimonas_sp.AAC.1
MLGKGVRIPIAGSSPPPHVGWGVLPQNVVTMFLMQCRTSPHASRSVLTRFSSKIVGGFDDDRVEPKPQSPTPEEVQ